jgi:hypothetical protein
MVCIIFTSLSPICTCTAWVSKSLICSVLIKYESLGRMKETDSSQKSESDNSFQLNTEVTNAWSFTYTSPILLRIYVFIYIFILYILRRVFSK